MLYTYETTIPCPLYPSRGNDYIIEHVLAIKFVTATNDINKILAKTGAIRPRQLKWDGNGTLILATYGGPWSIGKLIVICCSELSVEKFERQVLKNNLKAKRQTSNPFNAVVIPSNLYYNSKEKEKRLLSTKLSTLSK